MRWLEIIKLRSIGKEYETLKTMLGSIDRSGQKGLMEIKTFRHTAFETDLSLHLYWESEKTEKIGSALGLRLAQALKEFGLIDHSLWIEEEKTTGHIKMAF
jgi:hypothetical protein